ncbi:enoyl-CoA hydratase [Scopulibacillus daqui]|uniref:Enoyl-CoA hydratase n=1 Tax=Scopulibacillus daqui TaxID=1469162 RepID=A0ABS2PXG7_9BACL|nr:enoyl-CoA hydratase [Scopulibacillus daqui]MBM7644759.1 enoyl-CoA hydratase [Scopulibacillus daqui]
MTVVDWELEDHTAVIVLNHPPANALSSQLIKELSDITDELENNVQVKAIVIYGEGRFFSAGADIKEFTQIEEGKGSSHTANEGQRLFNRMENFKKPIIAAIHGAALGGGLELAMACHIRLAAKGAKLGLPEVQLGLIPGFAGTQRLPRLVGVPKAAEMILTSQPVQAEEALQLGLINRVVEPEELLNEAKALAALIASKSAVAVSLALDCLSYARDGKFAEGQSQEAINFSKAFSSEDAKEGIAAFIQKRKPVFQDK